MFGLCRGHASGRAGQVARDDDAGRSHSRSSAVAGGAERGCSSRSSSSHCLTAVHISQCTRSKTYRCIWNRNSPSTAILRREDPRDCLVSTQHATLDDMPAGARIGTSSLRRELMLRARFPQLTIGSIRGNVGTRLAKLDKGDFDALVLAAAGLEAPWFRRPNSTDHPDRCIAAGTRPGCACD